MAQVFRRPDIRHGHKAARVRKSVNRAHITPDNPVQVGPGAVVALFQRVARLAFVENALALAGIGFDEKLRKARPGIRFRVALAAIVTGFDYITLGVVFAMAAGTVVDQLGRPFAHKENQQRATETADDLGECHRIEHMHGFP